MRRPARDAGIDIKDFHEKMARYGLNKKGLNEIDLKTESGRQRVLKGCSMHFGNLKIYRKVITQAVKIHRHSSNSHKKTRMV